MNRPGTGGRKAAARHPGRTAAPSSPPESGQGVRVTGQAWPESDVFPAESTTPSARWNARPTIQPAFRVPGGVELARPETASETPQLPPEPGQEF